MLEKGGAWRAEEARGGTLDFQAAGKTAERNWVRVKFLTPSGWS